MKPHLQALPSISPGQADPETRPTLDVPHLQSMKWTEDLVYASGDLVSVFDVEEDETPRHPEQSFRRHTLDANFVRAAVMRGDRVIEGRAVNASVNGLFIQSAPDFELGTLLRVDLTVGNENQCFEGRVARVTSDGFGLHLKVDDATSAFRYRFVEQAISPGAEPPLVVIQAVPPQKLAKDSIEKNAAVLRQLAEEWARLELDIENDIGHQTFISHCLQARRLEFALARYRELRSIRPDLDLAEKYMGQIGTLLGFAQQNLKTPEAMDPWKRKTVALVMALVVIVAGAIWIAQVSGAKKVAQRDAELARQAADEVYFSD